MPKQKISSTSNSAKKISARDSFLSTVQAPMRGNIHNLPAQDQDSMDATGGVYDGHNDPIKRQPLSPKDTPPILDSTYEDYDSDADRAHWAWDPHNASAEARDLYPATRQTLKQLGLLGRVWQGVGDDPSSKHTHWADGHYPDPGGVRSPNGKILQRPYGGAVDINMEKQWDKPAGIDVSAGTRIVGQLRSNGIVAWYRVNTGPHGNDFVVNHIHMVDPAAPNLRPEKIHQIAQYLRGQSGLGNNTHQPYQPSTPAERNALWRRVDPSNRKAILAALNQ